MSNAMRKMLNNSAVWDNYAPAMIACVNACGDAYALMLNDNRIEVCLFDIPFARG